MTDTAALSPAWKDAIYHDHQEYGIRWMLDCEKKGFPIPETEKVVRGGILGDKMGVGKTIQSIGLIVNGDGLSTLVVTPLAVRGQWESEFRRSDVNLYLPTQWGQTWKAQGALVPGRRTVYLVHYDKVASKPELCKGRVYDRMILDEAHTIRNAGTRKALSILKIAESVKYKWALTGTPITNSMDDCTTYLKFIGFPTAPGKKWQESYMEWAQNIYLSRRLTECPLKGDSIIPPTPIEEVRRLDFTSKQEEAVYAGILKNEESKWRDARALEGRAYILEKFAILLRLRQVSVNPQIYIKARTKEPFGWSGPQFNHVSRKFDEVSHLMREAHEAGEAHKWIVFCQFHEEMILMEAFLKAHPFVGQILQYHGGMSMKEREAALKESKSVPEEEGSRQDVFLIQLKAGSTGLNLQQYDRIIFVSPWWTPSEMEQAKARAVRIGQKKVVKIYQLQLRTEEGFNIDEFMMDKVFQKKELGDMFESWSVHLKPEDTGIVCTP
jgi:SNF2 family DNA or RNA helicase